MKMPSTMQVWRVSGDGLRQLDSANVAFEKQLEDWIEADISLIGLDGLIVGRQVRTDHGGFIDLLAINDQLKEKSESGPAIFLSTPESRPRTNETGGFARSTSSLAPVGGHAG